MNIALTLAFVLCVCGLSFATTPDSAQLWRTATTGRINRIASHAGSGIVFSLDAERRLLVAHNIVSGVQLSSVDILQEVKDAGFAAPMGGSLEVQGEFLGLSSESVVVLVAQRGNPDTTPATNMRMVFLGFPAFLETKLEQQGNASSIVLASAWQLSWKHLTSEGDVYRQCNTGIQGRAITPTQQGTDMIAFYCSNTTMGGLAVSSTSATSSFKPLPTGARMVTVSGTGESVYVFLTGKTTDNSFTSSISMYSVRVNAGSAMLTWDLAWLSILKTQQARELYPQEMKASSGGLAVTFSAGLGLEPAFLNVLLELNGTVTMSLANRVGTGMLCGLTEVMLVTLQGSTTLAAYDPTVTSKAARWVKTDLGHQGHNATLLTTDVGIVVADSTALTYYSAATGDTIWKFHEGMATPMPYTRAGHVLLLATSGGITALIATEDGQVTSPDLLLGNSQNSSTNGTGMNTTKKGRSAEDIAEEQRANIAALVGLIAAVVSLLGYGVYLEKKYPEDQAMKDRRATLQAQAGSNASGVRRNGSSSGYELDERENDSRYRKEIPQYKSSEIYMSEVRNSE